MLNEPRVRHYESCLIFVGNSNHNQMDTFSMVDVAITASRITDQCIEGTKYGFGGAAALGSPMKQFFIAVGGLPLGDPTA